MHSCLLKLAEETLQRTHISNELVEPVPLPSDRSRFSVKMATMTLQKAHIQTWREKTKGQQVESHTHLGLHNLESSHLHYCALLRKILDMGQTLPTLSPIIKDTLATSKMEISKCLFCRVVTKGYIGHQAVSAFISSLSHSLAYHDVSAVQRPRRCLGQLNCVL